MKLAWTRGLQRTDVRRLEALRALLHLELDLLPLGEGAEAFALDGGVVAEDVLATAVLRDEPEALRVVEPLHGASSHVLHFLTVFGPAESCGWCAQTSARRAFVYSRRQRKSRRTPPKGRCYFFLPPALAAPFASAVVAVMRYSTVALPP